MPGSTYTKFLFSPLNLDGGSYVQTQKRHDGHDGQTNAEQAVSIEELKKVNEELRQARRAALNLMEDAILSKEALQKSEEKYRTLFQSIDEGFTIIEFLGDSESRSLDFRFVEVNESFERQTGNQDVTGKLGSEINPEVEAVWIETFGEVARTGEPRRLEIYHQKTSRWYDVFATRIGSAEKRQVGVVFQNITERKQQEEKQQYLLQLSDALREYSNPDEVLHIALKIVGEYLNLDRVVYNEIDPEVTTYTTRVNYLKPGFSSVVGSLPMEPFKETVRNLQKGITYIQRDVERDDKLSEAEKQACHSIRVQAFVTVPLVKKGQWVCNLVAHYSKPRNWAKHEIIILEETAERTWAAVEKAKAEEATRKSEERKEFLLKLNDTIRQLNDPLEIQYEAARLVAEQLKADRVHFAEITKEEQLVIRKDYVRGNAPSIAGTFKAKVIAAALKLDRDEPVVIADTQTFPLLSDEEKAILADAKIRSQLSVALSKMGKKVASFAVDQTTPREWTPLEISILQDAAERTWLAVERAKAEEALRENEALLAKELEDTKQLQKISSRIIEQGEENNIYNAIVDSAMEIMHSDFASIQVLNSNNNQLLLFAWKGFHPGSAEYWKYINSDSTTSCGQAFQQRTRIIVPNVEECTTMSREDLNEYHRSGVASVQSTPLVSRSGTVVGMISTHWRKVHHPSEHDFNLFDVLARQTADLVERKQAEEALRASKERLQKAIQIETVGVLFFNDEGQIAEANTAFFEMTGYTLERINNFELNLKDITPPEWIPAMKNAMQQIMTVGIATPYEKKLIRADGSHLWCLCAKARISKNDNIEYIIDVTTRKQAEDALRYSEERFRTLADAVPQVIWTNNSDGEADYFNQRWYKYSGLNYEQSAGPGWQAIVHPDDAPASIEKWNKALAAGETFDTEYRLKNFDGDYCWFIGRNVPLKNYAGKVTGWFGSATDIEGLKQAQEKLRQSEARLRITMDSAIDYAIIAINTERKIERWSSGAEKTFGYTEAEVIGKSADIIFTEEDRKAGAPQQEMETARDEGRAADERWHLRRDGSKFFMSGAMAPIYDGSLTGYVKVARDMTEHKLLEQQKDDFIAIASHELRTPLTGIKAYTEMLYEMYEESSDTVDAQLAIKLNEQVDRLVELVRSLLDATKLTQGQLALSIENFNLDELIRERIEDLKLISHNHELKIVSEADNFISADKKRIGEVLTNFISNAIKYSPKGGEVIITKKKTTEGIQVSVQDNGIGIPEEVKDKIFGRFYRVNNANVNTYPGLGLGLYIAGVIIQQHNGKIWLESALGKGSTFYFVLPYS